jgi:hypothetical protein
MIFLANLHGVSEKKGMKQCYGCHQNDRSSFHEKNSIRYEL